MRRARVCIHRGVVLGQHLPPVLMRAANFHFQDGQIPKALEQTSQVLALVASYDGIIFATYRRMGVPVETMLSAGIPAKARALRSFLRHLLGWADPEDVARGWDRLAALGYNDDQLAGRYLDYVLQRHLYDKAIQMWRQLDERAGD